ncbi:delta-8 sphingolipid desaturase [Suhomyces tanzawaensis NRRL Y-17324]|uniref:Delta 8-(E)-sphingolipid desaturase n=1 Tax=Suhomyces tanzawaensis NRRL Y-17324 TaxID=984487 RepID=A0A1E4SG52_9ASCO|nr:delta-8 sphingolipid desaturase [Suhomyces tanzawaensis NRRL Y-17324]ODV78445.1 delta-8 sphingolipid desaturase [Suhomyces tanzawaensis NRRL Y-17324]
MTSKTLSRNQIVNLIADGKAIVIYKNHVLNLTAWLSRHPGGEKAVYHMIGRDATDEMNAYHSLESIKDFTKWKIGSIDYRWENLLPPIQGAVYTKRPEPTKNKDTEDVITTSEELAQATSSSDNSINEIEYKGIGFPKVAVLPVVPQNELVTDTNKDILFPIKANSIIRDPKELMERYDNKLAQDDLKDIPPLDHETQETLRQKYNLLHNQIKDLGFYECNLWDYGRELIKIGSLFLYSFSFLKLNYLFLSAVFMGLAWHQMTFIAHDAGHVSITHNYQLDNLFGMLIADWFGGLSLGWWKRNHNVHHLITNDPVHDPDIQHLPFFAVSTRLFNSVYSTYYERLVAFDAVAKITIPIQNFLYYPILGFGRFNLYVLSWTHLLRGDGPKKGKAAWFRYFELVGLSFFFFWFFYLVVYRSIDGGWNRFNFVLVSHFTTMMVHVQITLSHFAMSTSDLGVSESFVSRQIRTTMDVDCPEWLDFFHGGLQFQAIHHLFPRLPRHNFRRVQPYVINFCKDVGIKYSIYGFYEGNSIVIGKLGDIAKQCSIMLEATKKYDGDLY